MFLSVGGSDVSGIVALLTAAPQFLFEPKDALASVAAVALPSFALTYAHIGPNGTATLVFTRDGARYTLTISPEAETDRQA